MGSYVVSLQEMTEIMGHVAGWEKTIDMNLKLDNGAVVIGNDKLPAVLSVKLRIIGSASIASCNSGSPIKSVGSPQTPSMPRRRIGCTAQFLSFSGHLF